MRARALLLPVLLLQVACAVAPPPSSDRAPAPDARPGDPPLLEERALLLLLEDRKLFEPSVATRFEQGEPELRELLAVALGRIGDSQGRPYLEILLADAEPTVRRAAAFGLGEMGDKAATTALLRSVADPDRETAVLAVEALAKLEAPLPDVDRALLALPESERWPRLLPALFRWKAAGVVPLAQAGLALTDPELHFRAAYALSREPQPEGAPFLRGLLADPNPLVRGWAARALGAVGDGGDLALLRPLLDDGDTTPVVQALRAARRLIAEGKAAAPVAENWVPRLLALFADERNGVAITAIEAAGVFLREERLAAALRELAGTGEGRRREVALLALADGRDARAAELAARAALAGAPLRARAAEAAGRLGALELLAPLERDAVAGVRAAALQARLDALTPNDGSATGTAAAAAGSTGDLGGAGAAARAALTDADPVVRSTALGWLAEHALAPLVELDASIAAAQRDEMPDARIAAAGALRARAQAEALERGAAVIGLEKLAADADYLVRREAAKELRALERPVPALGPATAGRELAVYREIVRQTSTPREAEIQTRHGAIRVRLACPQAPLTCLNFLQLAGQGYFDDVAFHRVVPDFVVQGGDPRGDGSGGPGYAIRDEINRLRYHRGAVGMALSGPDTGGSQFFFTLTPQPHLDGGYTIFGEVIAGMEVVDRIVQGDVMLRVTPATAP